MLRLLAGDSSISVRITRRSSVAEITGNSMTSPQPNASKHCKALDLLAEVVLEPRHSQKAGMISRTHARLSNSSINPSRNQ